ncbi:single-stranded-DNA-specific exonuclease RecJ [bacterium]|nr:single-stranded-DNA-specific exonuclease RecJ [bacterium]
MISITGKKWEEKKINHNSLEKIKQDYSFSDIVSKLIISRNFDKSEIYSINNKLELTNVFFNNIDFKESVDLIANIINKKENICILGDYDVDGSAATSLFARFFKSINHPFFFYIPDRKKDGYGATKKLFIRLIKKKPKLIIMVDCGSTSVEAIDYLNVNNIKSLIIDHHEINHPYPKANVIINPKKNNGYIEYDYLCATSLVYFFLDLLLNKIKSKINIRDFLIYVLLATVCDVMPLRKLNRLISLTALNEFDINKNNVFKELYNLNSKKNKININDLGYLVGPILNAGGRLGKSSYATELLSSNNSTFINKKINELIVLNNKRREIESIILNDIDFDEIEKNNKNVIIYYNPNINEGLIGIIAARLKDYFNKPSIVITNSNNLLKGSARSFFNFNIGRVMKNLLNENIIISGGGHNMAAGFTLEKSNLKIFEKFINSKYSDIKEASNYTFKYDSEISSTAFNKNFFNDIKKIEPFGNENPIPIFFLRDLKVIKPIILKNKHISLILKSKIGYSIKSISFNSVNTKIGEYLLNYKKNLNVLGEINENFWNGKNTLQLTVRDLIL